MIGVVLGSIVLGIECLNILLHGFGCLLLLIVYKQGHNDTQTLYLINLALSELLWNFVLASRDFRYMWLVVVVVDQNAGIDVELDKFVWMSNIMAGTGITYNVVLAMLYFTGDRLLHITLHLRYEEHWSTKKSSMLITCTWICNILIGVSFSIAAYYNMTLFKRYGTINRVLILYIYMTFHIGYLLFAFIAYLLMFRVYLRSERRHGRYKSVCKIFAESRFFMAVILIGMFLVFTVLPSIVRCVWDVATDNSPHPLGLDATFLLSTRLSHTIDAVVYIFLQKHVRDLLKKFCGCHGDGRFDESANYRLVNTTEDE